MTDNMTDPFPTPRDETDEERIAAVRARLVSSEYLTGLVDGLHAAATAISVEGIEGDGPDDDKETAAERLAEDFLYDLRKARPDLHKALVDAVIDNPNLSLPPGPFRNEIERLVMLSGRLA